MEEEQQYFILQKWCICKNYCIFQKYLVFLKNIWSCVARSSLSPHTWSCHPVYIPFSPISIRSPTMDWTNCFVKPKFWGRRDKQQQNLAQIFFPKKYSPSHIHPTNSVENIFVIIKKYLHLLFTWQPRQAPCLAIISLCLVASLFSIFYLFPCAFSCCLSLRLNLHSRLDGDMRGGQLGASASCRHPVDIWWLDIYRVTPVSAVSTDVLTSYNWQPLVYQDQLNDGKHKNSQHRRFIYIETLSVPMTIITVGGAIKGNTYLYN